MTFINKSNKISRRDFIRTSGLATAAFSLGIFPSKAKATPLDQINFYVPELGGTEYDNQLVEVFDSANQLIASGTTLASRVSLDTVGIEEELGTTLENKISAYYNGSRNIIKFPVHRDTDVKIILYNLLGQEIKTLGKKHLQRGNHKLDFNGNGLASGPYFVKIETDYNSTSFEVNIIGGAVQSQSAKSKIINFNTFNSKRAGRLARAVDDLYKVVVSDSETDRRHYTRTFYIDDVVGDIEKRVTGYVEQDGVNAQLFKDFCEEANFRELWDYTGLKTIFGNPNAQYWIASHHYNDGSTATADEQAYVRSLIENEIYPYIEVENRLPIYVEDPNNPENLPIHQNGVILVMPRNSGGFGIAPMDEGQDGIIDWASIYLPQGQWDEVHKGQILEELLSALVAPNQVSNTSFIGYTILRSGGGGIVNQLTEIDKQLIKICEYYQPLEQRDNILGL